MVNYVLVFNNGESYESMDVVVGTSADEAAMEQYCSELNTSIADTKDDLVKIRQWNEKNGPLLQVTLYTGSANPYFYVEEVPVLF